MNNKLKTVDDRREFIKTLPEVDVRYLGKGDRFWFKDHNENLVEFQITRKNRITISAVRCCDGEAKKIDQNFLKYNKCFSVSPENLVKLQEIERGIKARDEASRTYAKRARDIYVLWNWRDIEHHSCLSYQDSVSEVVVETFNGCGKLLGRNIVTITGNFGDYNSNVNYDGVEGVARAIAATWYDRDDIANHKAVFTIRYVPELD